MMLLKTVPIYLETDEQGYCVRRISDVDGVLVNSCIDIEGDHALPEGDWSDCLDDLTPISQAKFDKAWKQSCQDISLLGNT